MVIKIMMDKSDFKRLEFMPKENEAIKELVDRYNYYCKDAIEDGHKEKNYDYIISIDLKRDDTESSMVIVAHYDEEGIIIIDETDVLY